MQLLLPSARFRRWRSLHTSLTERVKSPPVGQNSNASEVFLNLERLALVDDDSIGSAESDGVLIQKPKR